jgi:hypothetical protein
VAGLKPTEHLPFRWGAFAVFLLLTGASILITYQHKTASSDPTLAEENKRALPVIELTAGLIAAVAWGLAMPGSALDTVLTGDNATITAAAITITGAAVLCLMTPWLTKGSTPPAKKPEDDEAKGAPRQAGGDAGKPAGADAGKPAGADAGKRVPASPPAGAL